MRVLVVDDSVVFRSTIKEALAGLPSIELLGAAPSGKVAIQRLQQESADVITLDYEMPELNGIETIREIRRLGYKARIILFTSHTKKGGQLAIEALEAGADDVVAKPKSFDSTGLTPKDTIRAELLPKIMQFVDDPQISHQPRPLPITPPSNAFARIDPANFKPDLIVIGSSTGGPTALEKLISGIKGPLSCPIMIVQHMPPIFTACLAERLNDSCSAGVVEAKHGEVVANKIYIAPGEFHMTVSGALGNLKVRLDQGPPINSVRPAVDNLFQSTAQLNGKKVMSYVLTGMGQDGLIGARAIKASGGCVMIQNKASSTVFGMPGAIHREGFQDHEGDLELIKDILWKQVGVL